MPRAPLRDVRAVIRRTLATLDISQGTLAALLGLDRDTITNWLHGHHLPTAARWAMTKNYLMHVVTHQEAMTRRERR